MLVITIANTPQDKKIADNIVINHHSYVASPRTVGRCLKYLIHFDNRIIGTFWIGSGFKPTPKAILNHFNLSQNNMILYSIRLPIIKGFVCPREYQTLVVRY